ncbi:MAG: hypothetical protein BWY09_01417 [Candidatus Hydrogenedentes bacterium ADurb.Bin179]|nr:MAG: hypothetical protein BWY09_01417 [Candidatus Hydrogenedentes bacterium ADurb.Bin179]
MFECRVKIPIFLGFVGLLQLGFRFLQQSGHILGPLLYGLLRYRCFGSVHFKTACLLRVMGTAGKRQNNHQRPDPACRPSKRVLFTRFETAYAGFAFHRERYPYRFAGAITGGLAFPPQRLPSGGFSGPRWHFPPNIQTHYSYSVNYILCHVKYYLTIEPVLVPFQHGKQDAGGCGCARGHPWQRGSLRQ